MALNIFWKSDLFTKKTHGLQHLCTPKLKLPESMPGKYYAQLDRVGGVILVIKRGMDFDGGFVWRNHSWIRIRLSDGSYLFQFFIRQHLFRGTLEYFDDFYGISYIDTWFKISKLAHQNAFQCHFFPCKILRHCSQTIF